MTALLKERRGEHLARAYAECADITRREARNFFYGIALLPPVKRRAMTAVYAFARRIDDIGDGDLPDADKLAGLIAVRHQLHTLELHTRETVDPVAHRPRSDGLVVGDDPVLTALADAARRLPIPLAAFDELIDGCAADVAGRRYARFEDLAWYCRCVAGSIGRLSLGVYDPPRRPEADALADTLGLALQLTNIVRDLREDRQQGRVYLPAEDLDSFGCTLALDAAGDLCDPPERFDALVRFEVRRARDCYAEGLTLLSLLDHRSAACTAAMAGIYRRLLDRIEVDPALVRTRRLSLPGTAKAQVAVRALVRGRV